MDLQYYTEKISEYFRRETNGEISIANGCLNSIEEELNNLSSQFVSSKAEDGKIKYDNEGVAYEIEIAEQIISNLKDMLPLDYPKLHLDSKIQLNQLKSQFKEIKEYLV